MKVCICPKQGPKMEGVVLNGVGILSLFGSGSQTLSGTPSPKHGPSALWQRSNFFTFPSHGLILET